MFPKADVFLGDLRKILAVFCFAITCLLSGSHPATRLAYRPSTAEVAAAYHEADSIGRRWVESCAMLHLAPNWIGTGDAFWYRRDEFGPSGKLTPSFVKVNSTSGEKTALFDQARLAQVISASLGHPVSPSTFNLQRVSAKDNQLEFSAEGARWRLDLSTYVISKLKDSGEKPSPPDPWVQDLWLPSKEASISPDRVWTAHIEGNNVVAAQNAGLPTKLTSDGAPDSYYARLVWSADSKHLIAIKVRPGDRNKVYLIQTSPPTWAPAKLLQRVYDRPGDRIDTFEVVTLDPTKATPPVPAEPLDFGDLPELRPTLDGAFTYSRMDRGYGRWRVFRLDPSSGQVSTVIDEHPPTFVDSTALIHEPLVKTDEIVYSDERDGWHHLYLADGKGGSVQITKGPWVVRGITKIDEEHRQIVFSASGLNPREDPYFVHYYRINFDGSNLVPLTPTPGNHDAVLSPDGKTMVDTYSTVLEPPVHELRNAETGALIATLEHGDVAQLRKSGWKPPQPFVAKARDAVTDIYGLVFRPLNFNPKLSYPVVEDIYAGPQDSFVPKSFSPNFYDQRVADLGFIVVKIDGMGTRNRSKAFHDVCYKDLADAGFPDRILWMKALAKTDPSVDLSRVGVFGTSAGGQNAGGAVLFHPEFYKVAVASCGCHDNRLDKIWWNEQWMGKIGPHYAKSSNIENAAKLKGKLLLMVGELDTNVPPESTFRFAAALQTAGKDYDLVIIPNSDHTAGGPYGERKRRDFLVRNLLGVEPPDPNR